MSTLIIKMGIDTQGMSPKMTPEETAKWKAEGHKKEYKPMMVNIKGYLLQLL